MGLDQRPRMKVLLLTLAAVGAAMAGKGGMGGKGEKFMEMMGGKGGKMPDMMENMGKPSKPGMGMGKGKPSKGEMVQQMMAEKKGLCLSQDEVHMICGMGTNLQRKMDAALKQCMPMEMMAATMDDMQAMSMSPDTKLLSSGRAFDFEEPSDRGIKKGKKVKKPSKMGKKPSKMGKKPKKPSKKSPKKPTKKPSKKPSNKPSEKPSEFKSCKASCPSMDEMNASAMEEMETELCVLNAIGWIDDKGNMKQDVEDADMAEFPAAVKEAVSEAKIKDCAEVAN